MTLSLIFLDVPEICRRFFFLPSLMLRHVCSSFFLTIILLHYTWGMVSQGKKSFGEGESRLCDNFCGSNSNEFSYMAPWIWWFGTMYRLNIIAFIIYEYQTSNIIYNLCIYHLFSWYNGKPMVSSLRLLAMCEPRPAMAEKVDPSKKPSQRHEIYLLWGTFISLGIHNVYIIMYTYIYIHIYLYMSYICVYIYVCIHIYICVCNI